MCIYYKLHIISGLVLVGLYQCLLLATDYFVMFILMVEKWLGKKNGIIKELNDIELLKFIMEEYRTIISVKNTFDGREFYFSIMIPN